MKKLCVLLGLLGLLDLAGCTETRGAIEGTQSLRVTLLAPTDPGSVDNRLPDTAHTVTIGLEALDAEGDVDTSFSADVRVYAQFLGTLTPELQELPLATITVTNGVATNKSITLPDTVLGPTTLWIDNGVGIGSDYDEGPVTGTSPTLWYRDPFIQDLQRPRDELGIDALQATPLQDKQISVSGSRHGARGRLVVTSTFSQGYTVSDVRCADDAGNPPCTAEAYDHMLIFTFSAPRDDQGNRLAVGQVLTRFTGGLSEFNGLTEVGFPRTYGPETLIVNPALLPAPVELDMAWFGPLGTLDGAINFERNEAGPIQITDAYVCPLDEEYDTYKQWKLDPTGTGTGCAGNRVINVITSGTDFTRNPGELVGMQVTVVGILRPVNIGTFNVWIIYPRGASDIDAPL